MTPTDAEPLNLREQVARIDRELADAAHKRAMAADLPKGAEARSLATGAAVFAAGGTFVGAVVAALALILHALKVI